MLKVKHYSHIFCACQTRPPFQESLTHRKKLLLELFLFLERVWKVENSSILNFSEDSTLQVLKLAHVNI